MFGEKVYLKSLPKYGEHELFLSKKDQDTFLVKSRNFERLDDKIFVVKAERRSGDKCFYKTALNAHFTIGEDGGKTLIDGTAVELVQLFFNGERDAMEFAVLGADKSGIDFSKFDMLFQQQEFLDDQERGNIFLKKQKRAAEEGIEAAVGKNLEIDFKTEDQKLMLRGVLAAKAVEAVSKEDKDYAEEFQEFEKIIVEQTDTDEPQFCIENKNFKLALNHGYYNCEDVTKHWLLENM